MNIKPRKNEPFHYAGGTTGCLLIHGFTGSPAEMAFLGEKLAYTGLTVTGLRLPGHGTTVEDMAETSWKDWSQSVREEAAKLRKTCQKVIAVGLSMGGLLALDLGTEGLVDGIVAMNAPMILQNRKARFAFLALPFKKFADKPKPKVMQKNIIQEDGFWYNRVPLKSLVSLNQAMPRVKRKLGQISCPVLLFQSTHDLTVKPKSVEIIENKLTVIPEVIYWKKSGHILTLGPEREEVAESVLSFIRKLGDANDSL